jgi:hypothetical protein
LEKQPLTLNETTTLLTKDYYLYLKENFSVEISDVDWILYYKRDYVFNQVYQHLLDFKVQALNFPSVVKLYKTIINLSCGYFGSNPSAKLYRQIKLRHNFPRTFSFERHDLKLIDGEEEFFILKTYSQNREEYVSQHFPLAHFCMIIEYGKLRLNQILNYFQTYMKHDCFDILYTQIDSIVLVLSVNDMIDAVPTSEKKRDFFAIMQQCTRDNVPGDLQLDYEFNKGDEWKFATAFICSYAILSKKDREISRMSGVNQLNPQQIYEMQCKLLEQMTVSIVQSRKINKLCDTRVHDKTIVFQSKKHDL